MLRRNEALFQYCQKCVDLSTVSIAWLLSYWFRFGVLPHAENGLFLVFIKFLFVALILFHYFFRKQGLYSSQRFSSFSRELTKVIRATTFASLALVAILYFFYPDKISRIHLITFYMFVLFFLGFQRMGIRSFMRYLRRSGKNLRHLLLVGDGPQLDSYVQKMLANSEAGISFCGWIGSNGKATKYGIENLEMSIGEAKKLFTVDSFIVGFSHTEMYKLPKIIEKNQMELIPLKILPDITKSFIGYHIEDYEGIPIITINHAKRTNTDRIVKRLFDVFFSGLALIALSPLYLFLAILVKSTSTGPVFYGQERVGYDGCIFKMWKFRSMRADAEKNGAGWTVENDPRRTKFGTFLRTTSLDELPQFWNVFVGDMSLVGPRPERPLYVEKFTSEIPAYMLRHKVKAGITGLAQINGWRGNTSLTKRIECDIEYIKKWSIWLDVKILFLTVFKGFVNRSAY